MQTEALSQASAAARIPLTDGERNDDLILIEALRRGDEGAFARLVDQHHASLRRVARLYISDRAVADEVVPVSYTHLTLPTN